MLTLLFLIIFITNCLSYYTVPEVEINLDLPPSQRWIVAIDAILTKHSWNNTFGTVFAQANHSLFDTIPPSDYHIYSSAIQQNWPQNYEELKGISAYFFSKYNQIVTVDYLSLWVYFHELSHLNSLEFQQKYNAACTGVLVRDINDNIFHGRNMDQAFSQARNLTLSMSFTKNGNELFKALDWYWFTTGIVTAFKSNILSIQENYRFEEQEYNSIIAMVKQNRIPQVLLFREILSKPNITFNQCSNLVATTPLISPMYAIVGGVKGVHSGQIITRMINDNVILDFVNISQHSTGNYNGYNPTYYMVQTNYDVWNVDPASDPRRTMAETMLSGWNRTKDTGIFAIGSNVQAVMSSWKVHNANTFYTGIFSANYDLFLGYIREAIVPPSDN